MKQRNLFSYIMLATLLVNLNANNIVTPQTIASNDGEESVSLTKSDFPFEEDISNTNEGTKSEDDGITLEEYQDISLNLSNGCLILNASDKDPMVTIFRPDLDTFKLIKLGVEKNGKNLHIARGETFENIVILSEAINIYSANIRIQNKYRGDRETVLGKTFEKVLPKKNYKGQILIDEYKSEMPMFWILNNEAQLTGIKNYFLSNFGELKNQMKPLLLIKILDTNNLNNLSEDNKLFLDQFFVTFSTANKEIRDFFDKTKNRIYKYGSKMSSPRYKGESNSEAIFRLTEKQFKEWKTQEFLIAGGVLILGSNIYNGLKPEVNAAGRYVRKITGIDNAVAWAKNGKDTVTENVIEETEKFVTDAILKPIKDFII